MHCRNGVVSWMDFRGNLQVGVSRIGGGGEMVTVLIRCFLLALLRD
jgi:hypothetical protein